MPQNEKPVTLKKRSMFLSVAASGKRWVAPGFILQIGKERAKENVCRYGLTASKKVGNAVLRNRARRRLRGLVREVLVPHASRAHDYVLVARPVTATYPYAMLARDLMIALKKMGVWREEDE